MSHRAAELIEFPDDLRPIGGMLIKDLGAASRRVRVELQRRIRFEGAEAGIADDANYRSEERASGTAGAVMGSNGKDRWRSCGTVTRAASGAFRDAHL